MCRCVQDDQRSLDSAALWTATPWFNAAHMPQFFPCMQMHKVGMAWLAMQEVADSYEHLISIGKNGTQAFFADIQIKETDLMPRRVDVAEKDVNDIQSLGNILDKIGIDHRAKKELLLMATGNASKLAQVLIECQDPSVENRSAYCMKVCRMQK